MRLFTITACAMLLAACQGYDPMPLDSGEHLKAWAKRDPRDASVVEYAKQLAKVDTQKRAPYDLGDGISLHEAEVVALFFNPDLRVARLHADVELAGAREAGYWDNPELEIDATRILASVDNPWILGAGISFTLPLSGRKGVEEDLAWAEHDVTRAQVIEREWEILVELRQLWRERSGLIEQQRLTEEFIADVRVVQEIANALVNAGELIALDARLFELEIASQRASVARLNTQQRDSELRIRELMGLRHDAPLALSDTIEPVAALPGKREDELLARNPLLEVKRAEYAVSEQHLRLEVRKQYPDLTIGGGYELEEGQSRISVMFGLPIPILNLNREGIARAKGARLASRAEFEGATEHLLHRLARAELRMNAAREQRAFIEREIAPLADQQVVDARRLAELGEFEALTQLEALARRFEARLQVLEAAQEEALAGDETLALLGPTWRFADKENDDE
ncbi:MAG: TolC family protein [Planctomycetes bacterium]|nr:TolC family protein [Planctomycetota bacterium]